MVPTWTQRPSPWSVAWTVAAALGASWQLLFALAQTRLGSSGRDVELFLVPGALVIPTWALGWIALHLAWMTNGRTRGDAHPGLAQAHVALLALLLAAIAWCLVGLA